MRKKRIETMIVLSVAISCAGGIHAKTVFAEDITVITQVDYENTKRGAAIYPNSLSNNNIIVGSTTGSTDVPDFNTTPNSFVGVADTGRSLLGGLDVSSTGKDVTGNTVTLNGGSNINNLAGGRSGIGTVTTNGNVTDNTVIVNGGYGQYIYGGYTLAGGNANNNTVTINGGSHQYIWGGDATCYGMSGYAKTSGSATDNVVIMNGGTAISVQGGFSLKGIASNNMVKIQGGTITHDVYAASSNYGKATDNTIIINPINALDISKASLYGSSKIYDQDANGNQTGNKLKVCGKDITAKNVANFSNIDFYLPLSTVNGDTMLTLTNSTGTNISYSTVAAGVVGDANLYVGDKVTLLTNANGVTTEGTNYGLLTEGVSLDYELNIYKEDENSVVAEITNGKTKPQTESLLAARKVGTGFLNSGMNLASGIGKENIMSVEEGTYVPFVVLSGDSMRYNSGSYEDTHGYHAMMGVSRKINKPDGATYLAPFFEAGWAGYDSHLGNIRGDGNINYYGIGFLARRQYENGAYFEGSLHYGRIKTTYSSNDLGGIVSEYYEVKTPYYAAYLGVGKTNELADKHSNIDVYGKYYFSWQDGETTKLSSGETYDFSRVTSNRLRVGTRYTHNLDNQHKIYAGVAYEYEFTGSVNAAYKQYAMANSDLKGSSGMFEVGYLVGPIKNKPVSLNIAVTGWVGKTAGIIPSIEAKWYF